MQHMTAKDDKPSRKPRRPRAKKKKEPVEDVDDNIDEAFKKKIQRALQDNLIEMAKRKNLSQKQISIINSFIEEHLSCFVLLGYTVNGNPVSLVNAPTQKDSDSLGTLLQKFFMKYVDPPTTGTTPPM